MFSARASALGVLPGTSAQEAAQVAAGEFPHALFLPILPKRGPGSDPVGRTAGLMSVISGDFSTSVVPTGWQISRTPGKDMQRAHDFLRQDQDAIEEHAQGFAERFTCSMVGPISWCAMVETASGEKLIRDPGAVSEVGHVLAEAIREHIAVMQRIFPDAQFYIMLDEPHAGAACAGAIPTASGLNTYVNIDRSRIFELWEPLIAQSERPQVGMSVLPWPIADQLHVPGRLSFLDQHREMRERVRRLGKFGRGAPWSLPHSIPLCEQSQGQGLQHFDGSNHSRGFT